MDIALYPDPARHLWSQRAHVTPESRIAPRTGAVSVLVPDDWSCRRQATLVAPARVHWSRHDSGAGACDRDTRRHAALDFVLQCAISTISPEALERFKLRLGPGPVVRLAVAAAQSRHHALPGILGLDGPAGIRHPLHQHPRRIRA